ncbi:MAG: phosphotransferase [Candidatus Obscuribacterales bacterium]
MPQTWDAELVVDEDLARKLVADQFDCLAIETIEHLGSGWDNTAYLINGELVFRFPRRAIAVPFIERESLTLPALSRHLPLTIPVPIYHGQASSGYPWPFAGYRIIAGTTACRAGLDRQSRVDMAPVLAEFLSCLHMLPVHDYPALGLDSIGKLDLERVRERSVGYLKELPELGLGKYVRTVEEAYDACLGISPDCCPVLVHGDFYVRHLIIDRGRITGVIDWGDLHLGNPAVDLSIVRSFLPPEAHARFREIYGSISESAWKLAGMRAAFYGLALASYGFATGDAMIANEARTTLAFVAESLL